MNGSIDSPGPEGVFRLCWRSRSIYLLWKDQDAVLVGAGGAGHMALIRSALEMRGLDLSSIRAILFTHAEPLLAENAALLRRKTGAGVYISRLEASRLAGLTPAYGRGLQGFARRLRLSRGPICKPCETDIYIGDGDTLDMWYGLSVMALPGPTPGHCGFYCRHLNLLFSGALEMARPSLASRIATPPFDAEMMAQSRAKIAKLHPDVLLVA